MVRLAVTGHRGLSAETQRLVDAAVRDVVNARADVVNAAHRGGIPVLVIWPDGATRD
ncbi:hypothetical protein [Saccharothrix lopnurensis]|uniref:Uncharacterized protein n=1 Tax=Saccharothrix lopnurensis TaxID=1670621 RepID=A0ABW1PCP1_9PSEU